VLRFSAFETERRERALALPTDVRFFLEALAAFETLLGFGEFVRDLLVFIYITPENCTLKLYTPNPHQPASCMNLAATEDSNNQACAPFSDCACPDGAWGGSRCAFSSRDGLLAGRSAPTLTVG
jgi:hypothetical protein